MFRKHNEARITPSNLELKKYTTQQQNSQVYRNQTNLKRLKRSVRINVPSDVKEPRRSSMFLNGILRDEKDDKAARREVFQATRDGRVDGVSDFLKSYEVDTPDDEQNSLLHHAVKFNREEIVQLLIKSNADINISAADGLRPIHLAAKFGLDSILEILVKNPKCNVNISDDKGQTALHYACRRGHVNAVKILTDHGAIVTHKDVDLNTALHFCAMQGSVQIARILIEQGADVRARDVSCITPAMLAAAEGFCQFLEELLHEDDTNNHNSKRAKEILEEVDDEECNCLHIAVQNNQTPMIEFCMNHDMDINKTKSNGYSAVHIACVNGFLDIVTLLLQKGATPDLKDSDDMTPLHRCALHNQVRIAKKLLERKVDINAIDLDWLTPMHCAAWKNSTSMLELLLTEGAECECQDSQMRTPLHWAVESEQFAAVDVLLKHGAEVNSVDRYEQTSLHYAAINGNFKILKLLLDNAGSTSKRDFEEKSSLHLAAESGNYKCVEMMLNASSEETNDDDVDGCTPLLLAAKNGHSRVLQCLLAKGADLSSSRDENRRTALMWAAKNGHSDALNVLLENNAEVNAVDKNKNSALHYASKHGYAQCVKLLLYNKATLTVNNQQCTPLDMALQYKNSKTCAAYFEPHCWKNTMELRNDDGFTPMDALIKNVPDIAEEVLNYCMEFQGTDTYDKDYTIRYHYKYIDPGPDDESSKQRRYFGLNTMVNQRRETLLQHPVVQTILSQKWGCFARYFFYVEFILYCLFLTTLTAYVIENDPPTTLHFNSAGCPIMKNVSAINKNDEAQSSHPPHVAPKIIAAEIGLYIFLVLNVIQHIMKLVYQGRRYFISLNVYFFWGLYIFTFLFIYPPLHEPCKLQWKMGAISCFVSWCLLVFYLRQFEFFGLYVLMFNRVLGSMIKTMFIFIFFIIAFASAFNIMLAKQAAFQNLPLSLVKVFVMTLGEMDYIDTFVTNGEQNEPFKTIAEVVFFIFIFLMPIVLMNLMIGIAVGDIETIKQDAYVEKIKIQVDYIYDLETKLPIWLQRKLYRNYFDFKPNIHKEKWLTKMKSKIFGHDDADSFVAKVKKTAIQDLLDEYAQNLKNVMDVVNDIRDTLKKQRQTHDEDDDTASALPSVTPGSAKRRLGSMRPSLEPSVDV